MFASKDALFAKSSGSYQISRSLRFRSSASAYLSRTPASAGNQQKFTLSCWVKRGQLGGSTVVVMSAYDGSSTTQGGVVFSSSDNLLFYTGGSGSYGLITTTAVYRDPSAWYHIVAVCDTTQATGTNRMALYVNGVAQSVTFNNTPAQNFNCQWNSTVNHTIGKYATGSSNIDGYLAEVNFIDGQALTPSSFGAFDTNGVWQPAKYTGSYGTNGFYLPYSDPSGSGNGNDTYTKLLLHGNGLNDSAWNGSSNHALTAFGSATTSTTQTKFGMSSSLYTLGSSTQYFRTDASADFKYAAASGSTNDFTFDFWFYPGASGTTQPVISIADTTYSSLLIYGTQLYSSSNNTGWDVSIGQSIGTPVTGQWNHYAIVRSGSTWYTFLNGVQQATWTNSLAGYDYTTNNFIQFGRAQGGALYSTGYYAEARWSAGIARWTSAFTPPTAPYSGGAGSDSSGNVNAWRPFNINTATSGTTYDSMIDSPTNYADGGNGRGNYCVMSPLDASCTAPNSGNLSISHPQNDNGTFSTFSMTSGRWWAECTVTAGTYLLIGICNAQGVFSPSSNAYTNSYLYAGVSGNKAVLGTSTAYGATYTANDVIGIDLNIDGGTITFYKQTAGSGSFVSQGAISLTANASGFKFYSVNAASNQGTVSVAWNFGQRPFNNSSIPTGASALNTQNLPTPTIAAGNKYFDATTYTGNGTSSSSTQTITNGGFQPDLVWVKSRSTADYHNLVDSVRGISTSSPNLFTNATSAETVYANTGITAVTSNGFTLLANGSYTNANGTTYIAWQWNAGGSTVTGYQPSGASISCNVRANVTAGFSVVTWTGNTSATADIGHGLGTSPAFVIVKNRDATSDWWTWHWNMASGVSYIGLNTTNADNTVNSPWGGIFNSTVFRTTNNSTNNANAANKYVAFCFTPVAGYSAFGKFTGNGSATGDGPFIFTNFLPRWVIIKRSTTGSNNGWIIIDTARQTYNVLPPERIFANDPTVYSSSTMIDVLSNGFKIRDTGVDMNASGATYIYAAFASNPFKMSRAF